MWATSAAMPNENTHAATIDQNAIAIGFGMRFFSITVLICKFCGRVGSSVPFSHLLGGLQSSGAAAPARRDQGMIGPNSFRIACLITSAAIAESA
jgi:hypothetical protein